ncbi:hypothetical protein ACHAW6_010080 [Cyclotella cf. meneghiniana]
MSQAPLWNLSSLTVMCLQIISVHGLMTPIEDHATYWYVKGEWKSFKYCKPMSHHNHAKHWVDNVDNPRHNPIGLEEVWVTKRWPHWKFTFNFSIAEVNGLNEKG